MHHNSFAHLDRAVPVKLWIACEFRLCHETLREPNGNFELPVTHLLRNLLIDTKPFMRLWCKISGPSIHRDTDLEEIMKINLMNAKRFRKAYHLFKLQRTAVV